MAETESLPDFVRVDRFEYDSRNLGHLSRHGVDAELADAILSLGPKFFFNLPDRSGSHMMVGPDQEGQLWTIIIVLVDADAHLWRPITGWPSTNKEIRAWRGE